MDICIWIFPGWSSAEWKEEFKFDCKRHLKYTDRGREPAEIWERSVKDRISSEVSRPH